MQEQISEEMADKLLWSIADAEIRKNIKISWKQSGYIKESALDRARDNWERMKGATCWTHSLLEETINLYETAVVEKEKEIGELKASLARLGSAVTDKWKSE